MATLREDPFRNHNFIVEIDGVTTASFLSVAGLEARVEVVEYRSGNEDITSRKLPGLKSFGNLILRRGLTKDYSLYQWFKAVLDGNVERRAGSVTVLDEKRQPQVRFIFREAWPCRLKYDGFGALENDVAIEELEIVVEDLAMEVG
jgi:phage tail-like protein